MGTDQDHPNGVVVIGKETVNKLEAPHLITIGRALAARGKTLFTTKTKGVGLTVAQGYEQEGGTPIFITKTTMPAKPEEIMVFTDSRYEKQLSERDPDWRTRDWLVFHNRKATEAVAQFLVELLKEHGIVLDSGTKERQ